MRQSRKKMRPQLSSADCGNGSAPQKEQPEQPFVEVDCQYLNLVAEQNSRNRMAGFVNGEGEPIRVDRHRLRSPFQALRGSRRCNLFGHGVLTSLGRYSS